MLAAVISSTAGIVEDLQSIGVPVLSAETNDSMLVVTMTGSLSEGDSLLKNYGGVFFTLVDSITGGWDVCGVQVCLEEADLIFRRIDMFEMLTEVANLADDDIIADWVLDNTRVFHH